jgi:hypothetical protein
VWKLGEEMLDLVELANQKALLSYRECCATGNWPTGYEEIRTIASL